MALKPPQLAILLKNLNMLKSTVGVHVSLLTKVINLSLRDGCFPVELKAAELTQSYKK